MALVRLAVHCALGALLCAITSGMPRHQAVRPDNQPAHLRMVRQTHVDPRTITLPVVDGNDIRFRFTRLSTENGLSQTKVLNIVQDNQGFMWFGTQYGLNRYDGYNFKVFVHDPMNPNSLSGVYINALFKDRDGALWVGCDQLLNRLEPSTEIFTKYQLPSVTHISQDTAGMLWLATHGSGLYSLDPKTGRTRHYSHDSQDASSLSSNELMSSGEDRTGRFWVSSDKGLDEFDRGRGIVTLHIRAEGNPGSSPAVSFYEDDRGVFWIRNLYHDMLTVLDRKTNTVTHYALEDREPSGRVMPYITFMAGDHDGNLWLATRDAGLLKYDRDHQRIIRFHNDIGDPESLPQNVVGALFPDQEGNMWASLGRMGLTHFGTRPLPFKRLPRDTDNPNSKVERFVGALYVDHQGILWVGTPDRLNRIDREAELYTSYRRPDRPAGNIDVIAIGEDGFRNLWIGTYGHGLLRLDRSTGRFKVYRHDPDHPYSLSSDIVTRFLVDHNRTFWVATADGLNRFDPATEHFTVYKLDPHRLIQSYLDLAEDRQGILWLGTDSSGLHRFDPATGHFTVYEHDMSRPDSLSHNRVNSVHFDRSGALWLGTQDGLDKFDPKMGVFTVYRRQEGLPGSAIGCILEDGHGDFWMSTNSGVTKLDPQIHDFKNYSTADGLPGPDLTGWGACSESATGEMFFGGFSGATAFSPERVTDSSYVPPVVLTDFRLFGIPVKLQSGSLLRKSINYTDTITLSHNQNIFSVGFSALSYFNTPTNRYRYMLEGLERRWNDVGSDQRVATYTTLGAGNYTFHVEGATSRGRWDEPGAVLSIRILPAWWNTWWFRALVVFVSLAVLCGLYKWRVGQLRRQERQLRDVINAVPANVWSTSPDGAVDFVNQRWQELTGLPAEEALGWNWEAAVHPDDRAEFDAAWRAAVKNRNAMEHEVRVRRPDGEYRWLFVRNVPLPDKRGKILKWYGTSVDIEDRKRAEERLHAAMSERVRLAAFREEVRVALAHEGNLGEVLQSCAAAILGHFDAAFARIWTTNNDQQMLELQASAGMYTHLNGAHSRIALGQHKIGLIAQERKAYLSNDVQNDARVEDKDWARREGMVSFAGYPLVVEDRVVGVMGLFSQKPLPENAAETLAFVADAIAQGIGRKHAEEERERLRQLEIDLEHINRVSMMGELTASLAHELSQPITAAITNAKTCVRWLSHNQLDLEEAREAATRTIKDGTRAAEIINGLRSFYKKGAPAQREVVDVSKVIREMTVLLGDEAAQCSVSVNLELADGIPTVLADRVQVQQVFMNLMLNAIEAMQKTGGELTIKLQVGNDGHLLISVSDTGVGFPGENADRVFDAFFTTKAQGTGMGLSICRRIIKSHGGRLWACANPGRGATFHFTLPTAGLSGPGDG